MPPGQEWEVRKERLRSQIELLKSKQTQVRAARKQLEARMKAEERRSRELEKMVDQIETRADQAESELESAEEELESAEGEYEEACEDEDDESKAELPDLSHIEAQVRRATERLARVDLSGLGERIGDVVKQSMRGAGFAGNAGFDVDRMREEMKGRANVVMTRVSDDDLATLDILVDAGLATSRSECAAMLVHEGMVARRELIERVKQKADQIRRLKESMREELKGMGAAKGEAGRRAETASLGVAVPPTPPSPPLPPRAPAPPTPAHSGSTHEPARESDRAAERW